MCLVSSSIICVNALPCECGSAYRIYMCNLSVVLTNYLQQACTHA